MPLLPEFIMPEFDYGTVNYGVVAACLLGFFIFLYFMQGHMVNALVSMVVVYGIISGIAYVFYADDSDAFRSKYLLLTVLLPLGLALGIKFLQFLFSMLTAGSMTSGKKKSSARSSRRPAKAKAGRSRNSRDNDRDDDDEYDDDDER